MKPPSIPGCRDARDFSRGPAGCRRASFKRTSAGSSFKSIRIVGNVDDAQDLTQETFIKALQRQEQIKDLEKAAHWLSRIASNTAIDFLRRHGRV